MYQLVNGLGSGFLHRLKVAPTAVLLLATVAACASSHPSSSASSTQNSPGRYLFLVDARTAAINSDFPDATGGAIVSAIDDGHGGWFIGGSFTNVGDVQRGGLAHLGSDGRLDPGFKPQIGNQVDILALARRGNTVFAGGILSGGTISSVAAFDARSGKRLWQTSEGGGLVGSLAFSNGLLYAGGGFTRIGGVIRDGIAALDATTGKPTSWQVSLLEAPGRSPGTVGVMSIAKNGVLYIAGVFGRVDRVPRPLAMAAVNARTGHATSWKPQPGFEPDDVNAILAIHGQVLVGGKNGFAVYDARTGRNLPWRKRLNGAATAFAASGNTVFLGANLGGGFDRVDGKHVRNLAAVVLPAGRFTNWAPKITPAPTVTAMAVSGPNVLVAG